MDFYPTKEEEKFVSHIKQVLDEQIKPNIREWKEQNTTPLKMFRILGDNGLLGFSKVDNGILPIPWQRNIHFYKELAQLSGGLAIASFAHSQLGVQSQYYFGTEEQKTEYLNPGASDEKILAFANTEPGAGSDAASISLSAKDEGSHYVMNGTKAYITNGDIADHIIPLIK